MKTNWIALLLAAFVLVAAPVHAQDKAADEAMAALHAAAKKDKRALVASTLKLTDAEANKFWPVYDGFQAKLETLARKRNTALEGLAMRDRPLTDAYAKNLLNELASVEEQEATTRRKATTAMMRALPPKKAALYMQLEWKLRAIRNYEVAAAFPLGG